MKTQQRHWGNIALRDKATRILREIDSYANIAQLGNFIEKNNYKYYEFEPNQSNNSIKGAIDKEQKRIWINADLAGSDKHFTLAHEIAHAVLHPDNKYIDYRKNNQTRDPIESEANVLAYELVMPLYKFQKAYIEKSADIEKLADIFFVPIAQVKKRIEFLKQQIKDQKIEDFIGL